MKPILKSIALPSPNVTAIKIVPINQIPKDDFILIELESLEAKKYLFEG